MRKKDLVDEVKPTASPTLCEKVTTVVSRLLKEMALACSINDADFTNLVGERKLCS